MPKFGTKYRTDQSRIKTVFVSAVLRETAERIRADQNAVVEEWDLFETGKVKAWLQGHFSVGELEGGGSLNMRYLTYYRFLDMPDPRRELRRAKRDGYHNYNQIVFGNLYNFALPEVQFGLTQEIHEQITGAIIKAQRKNKFMLAEEMLSNIASEDRFAAAILSKSMRKGYA